MSSLQKIKIFTGNANPALAKEIADHLGVSLGSAMVNSFSDGEIHVELNESVRGADVFIIQPTSDPVNEHLMELLVMQDAMRRASSFRITPVIPYYGYARQDRKAKAREPITAKLVANLITVSGAKRIVTVDLHAAQIQGLFDIPVEQLSGIPILAQYFIRQQMDNIVVVSPDLGSVQRAREFAERLGAPLAIIDRRHCDQHKTEVSHIIGDVFGKNVIMLDDMINTASTISQGAVDLKKLGAENIYACCTHAVLSGDALDLLTEAPIREVIVTNTIALPAKKKIAKIKVLSLAPLLAETIRRIHNNLSVSELFY